jgi:hypothetical protein
MYLVFVYQTQAYPKLTQQKCREKKPTITSKDKLSRYAISILNKERRLNSGSDIKASRYLFSLDLTPAIEQLKEAVKERVNEMMTEEFPDPDPEDIPLEFSQAEIQELSPDKFVYEIIMSGDEDSLDQASNDSLQLE